MNKKNILYIEYKQEQRNIAYQNNCIAYAQEYIGIEIKKETEFAKQITEVRIIA